MAHRHKYGWNRDKQDHRDRRANFSGDPAPSADLRPKCPPIYDQGHLGSCSANAVCGACRFECLRQGRDYEPSRLFLYYTERQKEGTVAQDSGASLRAGIKCTVKTGVCTEAAWPYDITKFTETPPASCYTAVEKTTQYERVPQELAQLKLCLQTGFPFVFGFQVHQSFESPDVAKTGIMPMPGANDPVLGGHAVMCVGYDDARQVFIIRNSWGTGWGDQGHFYMPYTFMTSPECSDMWKLELVNQK